jgi:hypothetical protein
MTNNPMQTIIGMISVGVNRPLLMNFIAHEATNGAINIMNEYIAVKIPMASLDLSFGTIAGHTA